jgi:hypothetical protein
MALKVSGWVAGLIVAAACGEVLAAGTAPQQAAPNPALRNATPYVLSLKVFDQCLLVQSRLMGTTREAVHTPCSCYAKKTIAEMTKAELDDLRNNGYFNDSAREKALRNIDGCKLKRPNI